MQIKKINGIYIFFYYKVTKSNNVTLYHNHYECSYNKIIFKTASKFKIYSETQQLSGSMHIIFLIHIKRQRAPVNNICKMSQLLKIYQLKFILHCIKLYHIAFFYHK